jgi:hypothetical protein
MGPTLRGAVEMEAIGTRRTQTDRTTTQCSSSPIVVHSSWRLGCCRELPELPIELVSWLASCYCSKYGASTEHSTCPGYSRGVMSAFQPPIDHDEHSKGMVNEVNKND